MIQEQKVLDKTIERLKNHTYLISHKGKENEKLLKNATKEPYFGQFEIHSDEEGHEVFYIGKQGIHDKNENMVVLDWRMPMASVFYNFTPGHSKQSYIVHDEKRKGSYKHTVDVLKKKEFTIINQKLLKIIQQVAEANSDLNRTITKTGSLTIADDFLREIIEQSETTGYLKEIIATIQREQDLAIRQTIDKNVIIQGVAGSGKSSIALHRLSFLLFNNKNLKPESLLILGPSNLFISSVKGLLPELNLERIKQTTVQDLMLDILKPVIKEEIPSNYSHYFEEILFKQQKLQERKIIQFKGSEQFLNILDTFLSEIKNQYEKRMRTVTVLGEQLKTESLLEIYSGYQYLSFVKRIEKFQWHVESHFKRILDGKVEELSQQHDFVVNKYLVEGGLSQNEYKSLADKMTLILNHKIKNMKAKYQEEMESWKSIMKAPDLVTLYKQVTSYDILSSFEEVIGVDTLQLFKDYRVEQLTFFDLAPIFYMYLSLYDEPVHFSHIVIDEAQDLSFVHFAALQKITRTMTILGDKDQSIFMEYGQYDWQDLLDKLFDKQRDGILTLNTSYRSTKEIIDVANVILKKQEGIAYQQITPLNRSGEKVNFIQVQSGEALLNNIVSTLKEWGNKYKRVAIIHKDEQKAQKLATYLKDEFKSNVKYISPDQEVENQSISVLASYHSKGMEFDGVILVNVNEESFPQDNLHARLLYVLLTRAQQEARVFYQNSPSPLIEECIETGPKAASRFDDIL